MFRILGYWYWNHQATKPNGMQRIYSLIIFLLCITVWDFSFGQTYPANFVQSIVANGISNPTAMAFTPDGRVFVAQQNGSLRVVKNGALLATAFVNLTVNSSGERGLIGIAIDPDFATNNYVYLYYTVPTAPIHNRISRFTANGDVVVPGSESIVLDLDPLSSATNHNGGAMQFGKDGMLYVAIGENANSANAQDLDTYHGKLLRINKDGSIPAGNPFDTGSEQRKRVWAYGLRNPFTFSIHPITGRILVNDVGQVTWEEINDATTGGKNFGWPTTEGMFDQATYPALTNPIYAYIHDSGDGKGCAITGGTFFAPTTTNYPASYVGKYFIQDLCNAWINSIDVSGATGVRAPFATGINGNSVSITTGTDGNLYYLGRNAGALYKIVYNSVATAPTITNQPADLTIAEGQTATFTVSATGSAPLVYQWMKGGVNINGATGATYSIANATAANNGDYTVKVSNGTGDATSTEATLTVLQNAVPVANILTPVAGATYVAGTNIGFSGSGTDTEDGALAAAKFSWQIDFHHNTHKHDQPAINGVTSGNFLVPNEGELAADVFYRIILTVTDSKGLTGKDSVDVIPNKTTMNFATTPAGLKILLDGQPVTTPLAIVGVEGIKRSIGVVSPQTMSGITYTFTSWSNGGAPTQSFATPTNDFAVTAQFSAQNAAPTANITVPAAVGATYIAGTNITFSGTGIDTEDGSLTASRFSWQIYFLHDGLRDAEPAINGMTTGTFLVPNEGELGDDVFYRIVLTVTDAQGLTGKDSVDVLPKKTTMNFATIPAGLKILLDGQQVITPLAVVGVEGIKRSIGIVSPQIIGGVTYTFTSWSNGGPATQAFVTPTNDFTVTALFSGPENDAPTADIITPAAGTPYVAGTNIIFSGSGTDPEEGALAAARFSWQIYFLHKGLRDAQPIIAGATSGTFLVPDEGEKDDAVLYRIVLTVTDAQGLQGKDSVDVSPKKSTLTFATSPPGLQVLLDGQPVTTPLSVVGVVGMLRSIGAVTPQVKDDVTYTFESWSNGGDDTQVFPVPSDDMSLVAQFSIVVGVEKNSLGELFSVYPNPSHQHEVTLKIQSTQKQPVRIRMIDTLSRDVFSIEDELQPGNNEFPFRYGNVNMGVYSVVVETNGKTVSRRLLVTDK